VVRANLPKVVAAQKRAGPRRERMGWDSVRLLIFKAAPAGVFDRGLYHNIGKSLSHDR